MFKFTTIQKNYRTPHSVLNWHRPSKTPIKNVILGLAELEVENMSEAETTLQLEGEKQKACAHIDSLRHLNIIDVKTWLALKYEILNEYYRNVLRITE